MEDEDGEGRIMDMWNILDEQELTESTLGNSLKSPIENVYSDVLEEENQLIRYNPDVTKDSAIKDIGPRCAFKGFKKRIIDQAREIHQKTSRNTNLEEQQLTHFNALAKSGKNRKIERKRERKITEYAQYLGLQPSSKYKCPKCHGWSNCGSTLKQNLCVCNPSMTPMPGTSESVSVPHASNFKITRKVYLCAACGTYFENWNLFLHMRDIHKRHICLFCLGMFGQAERLSYHLSKKHSVPEITFDSVEDFYGSFKGSCYLVCCGCETVFSESDNFFNHVCSLTPKENLTTSLCTLCRQTGTHANTCNFAVSSNTDKELNNITSLTVTDATHVDDVSSAIVQPSEKTVNLGSKISPKKVIKNNKNKHGIEDSHQQKSNILTKIPTAKDRCNDNQFNYDSDVQREITNNVTRDTVSETILEVSRYTGDSSDGNDENQEQVTNKDITYNNDEKSLANQNCQFDEHYDSVTETIMEVSRCTSDLSRQKSNETSSTSMMNSCVSRMDETLNSEDEELHGRNNINLSRSINSKSPSPVQKVINETATSDKKANTMCDSGSEFTSQSYDNSQRVRRRSSISRSLFSPQRESHVSDLIKDCSKDDEKEEKPIATNANESQASASFNAIPSSDRSLVIKITNRNSQFTVATATSRESEENNNAEPSTSEKNILNNSNRRKHVIDNDQVNDDSDSDSDKLAVIDSNVEEDEEAEDEEAEEVEVEEETEERYAKDENQGKQENSELRGATETTISVDLEPTNNVTEISDNHIAEETPCLTNDEARNHTISDGIPLAGEDVPSIDLNVEGTLESMELEELLKRCIEAGSPICVYCNHARQIAVNGKQLSLHMLAEHKFQPQHPAIIIHTDQFIARVKKSFEELDSCYFNLDSYNSTNGTYNVPNVRIYECFHCRFHFAVHKELYLHNRKMHQKTILICIMCKSTFYSYSELLCHLCPGIYSPNINVRYRCCLCSVSSLPSAFRLMVHLRKRHHACDVCLESTGNQQRLSNHVWKHKLHHLCYRCGIAYRNKPDITKHLFWKHGTESVLCRKCLQKKWPHIYHFCIPPTAFVCEECGSSFNRAVALKVHKRLHSGDRPYGCDECVERFISRKLLAKHQANHREPKPENININATDVTNCSTVNEVEKFEIDKAQLTTVVTDNATIAEIETTKDVKDTAKRVVDVYDLPPLNLSSDSDTDSEKEKEPPEKSPKKEKIIENVETERHEATEEITIDVTTSIKDIVEVEQNEEEKKQEARIMDDIWDNFKTYAASLQIEDSTKNFTLKESVPETDVAYLRSIVLADHDYHIVWSDKEKSENQATFKDENIKQEHRYEDKLPRNLSPDNTSHNAGCENNVNKRKMKTPKKKKQSGSTSSSGSSSDSDSSSCSCGTNCSCSSSSSSSSSTTSSSSDSDSSASDTSPKKQVDRKDSKKEKEETVKENNELVSVESDNKITIKNGPISEIMNEAVSPAKPPLLRESDLETDETDTDEDFYDEHPQLLTNKILTEKRNQLMLLATVAPMSPSTTAVTPTAESLTSLNNGMSNTETTMSESVTVVATAQNQPQQKRKTKTKKRKRGEKSKRNATPVVESIKLNIPKAFYQKNSSFSTSSPAMPTFHPKRSSMPCNDSHAASTPIESQRLSVSNQNIGGNSSETENKRSSKRKRVPKRFYGDSTDEEPQEKQPALKWRKMETPTFAPVSTAPTSNPKPATPKLPQSGKTTTHKSAQIENQQSLSEIPVIVPGSATESEDPTETSSESSESDTENINQPKPNCNLSSAGPPVSERPAKVYCYCQCPYDEVSEMIACDGGDCCIEWFHFECVGIMVPPKGKWYCPDCRQKYGIVENNEDYCD